ncbi:hypothetical protein OMCYN_01602 [cyanobiont of Ornithocercus magnificus]|nr:hypothetical protein OMCYN_01602 [cyanobiont of Ornithocercus magnificus]
MIRIQKPLAGICFNLIKSWVEVARRGKGGDIDANGTPWTRLPARELRDQVLSGFSTEVSTRTVYRALDYLVELKLVRREKRKQRRRWSNQDYWYTIPTEEQTAAVSSGSETSKTQSGSQLTHVANTSAQVGHIQAPLMANTLNTLSKESDLIKPPPEGMPPPATDVEEEGLALEPADLQAVLSSIPAPKTADQLQEERKKKERQRESEQQRIKQQAQANEARKAAAAARNINNQNWIAAELGKIRQKMAQNQAKGFKPTAPITSRKRVLELPERPVGRDRQGRTVKEVWVAGFKYLVVD